MEDQLLRLCQEDDLLEVSQHGDLPRLKCQLDSLPREKEPRVDRNQNYEDETNPMPFSFRSSFEGETSKAFEESNWSNSVTSLLFLSVWISLVCFIKVDLVLWNLWKTVLYKSRILDFDKKLVTWSWASFSRTFDKIHNRAIGQKSEGEDDIDFLECNNV